MYKIIEPYKKPENKYFPSIYSGNIIRLQINTPNLINFVIFHDQTLGNV